VNLSAKTGYSGGDIEPDLYKFGTGALSISWTAPRYPWVQYSRDQAGPQEERRDDADSAVLEAFFKLCRIAEKFATAKRLKRPLWGPVSAEELFTRRVVGS